MLSLGRFPTQSHCSSLLHNACSKYLHSATKPSCSVRPVPNLQFRVKPRNILCCNALKTKKKSSLSLAQTDGPDEIVGGFDDELMDFEDDIEIDGDGDGDGDEVDTPLINMKKWQENRPAGFGEGKEYDTSIEDKLMKEIEQSRKAQLLNLNRLKNSSSKPARRKEETKEVKSSKSNQDCFRVRLVNLPKKKNIHRDLQLAFNGVPGIVNIVPVAGGNEKTRDPVCKGLAFVDFKYEIEAKRFMQSFSGKSITFGKVQKQIKCEMLKPLKTEAVPNQSGAGASDNKLEKRVLLQDSWDEKASSEFDDADVMLLSTDIEDEEEINEDLITPYLSLPEKLDVREPSTALSSSLSKPETKQRMRKKKDKTPKINLGSANRLKIRDKEMLTGALSKYGANSSSTAKEPSR